ncbi:uncharacterized protein LOC143231414 isoform X2 [Tachypleus tridentatus]|uniref:uncharacterized protein LOC143231414 isoform X2 n=1 Tax=Tachypleus tridentatus TaxID=6853 RepID=UPI003FD18B61
MSFNKFTREDFGCRPEWLGCCQPESHLIGICEKPTSQCQDMLESLGIHSIESKGEAEAMCAFLNQCGVVDGCITEDSDFFLYGGLVAYRDFSIDTKLSKVHMYCMTNIETRLKLDRKKLIGLAVLLGCDYLPKGVPGVGKETAVKLMQKFEDVDVIQRFHEWRNDNKFKKLKLPQTAKKLTHCELCNHPGTEKQHVAKGCIFCGSELSCHQGTDDQECPCDWHGALKLRSDQGLELSVREKALRVPEFPFPQVIEEYLNYQDHLPKETVKWKSPKWTLFQPFTEAKLKWPVKYCWEKYLPLLTLWQLKTVLKSSECTTFKLNPIRIQKRKTVKGVPCFQVEWCKTANEDLPDGFLYVTVESEILFSMAYSSVTEKFVTEEKRKKCKTMNKPSPEDKEKNVVPVVCKGEEPRVRRRTQDAKKNPGCKEEPRMQRHLKSSSKEKESLDTHPKHQVGVNINGCDSHVGLESVVQAHHFPFNSTTEVPSPESLPLSQRMKLKESCKASVPNLKDSSSKNNLQKYSKGEKLDHSHLPHNIKRIKEFQPSILQTMKKDSHKEFVDLIVDSKRRLNISMLVRDNQLKPTNSNTDTESQQMLFHTSRNIPKYESLERELGNIETSIFSATKRNNFDLVELKTVNEISKVMHMEAKSLLSIIEDGNGSEDLFPTLDASVLEEELSHLTLDKRNASHDGFDKCEKKNQKCVSLNCESNKSSNDSVIVISSDEDDLINAASPLSYKQTESTCYHSTPSSSSSQRLATAVNTDNTLLSLEPSPLPLKHRINSKLRQNTLYPLYKL